MTAGQWRVFFGSVAWSELKRDLIEQRQAAERSCAECNPLDPKGQATILRNQGRAEVLRLLTSGQFEKRFTDEPTPEDNHE